MLLIRKIHTIIIALVVLSACATRVTENEATFPNTEQVVKTIELTPTSPLTKPFTQTANVTEREATVPNTEQGVQVAETKPVISTATPATQVEHSKCIEEVYRDGKTISVPIQDPVPIFLKNASEAQYGTIVSLNYDCAYGEESGIYDYGGRVLLEVGIKTVKSGTELVPKENWPATYLFYGLDSSIPEYIGVRSGRNTVELPWLSPSELRLSERNKKRLIRLEGHYPLLVFSYDSPDKDIFNADVKIFIDIKAIPASECLDMMYPESISKFVKLQDPIPIYLDDTSYVQHGIPVSMINCGVVQISPGRGTHAGGWIIEVNIKTVKSGTELVPKEDWPAVYLFQRFDSSIPEYIDVRLGQNNVEQYYIVGQGEASIFLGSGYPLLVLSYDPGKDVFNSDVEILIDIKASPFIM